MPLFLSEIAGTFQVASVAAGGDQVLSGQFQKSVLVDEDASQLSEVTAV